MNVLLKPRKLADNITDRFLYTIPFLAPSFLHVLDVKYQKPLLHKSSESRQPFLSYLVWDFTCNVALKLSSKISTKNFYSLYQPI